MASVLEQLRDLANQVSAEIPARPLICAPALPSVLSTGRRSSTDGKAGAQIRTAVSDLRN